MSLQDLDRAVQSVRARITQSPRVGLVLGSGLSGLVDGFEQSSSMAYTDIAGMATATVAGHPGKLVAGRFQGVDVIAMQGRLHAYEGHPLSKVVLGVRLMARLGVRTLIVTNAAGGLDPTCPPGSLLVISDHINLTGQNCLVGENLGELGPRFPDLSEAYDRELRTLAHEAARSANVALFEGVYAGVLGPSYETPAEVRMLRLLGASAVGMSTVHEVIAARHMGVRVLGFSCLTNLAAGLSPEPLRHADVERTARAASAALTRIVGEVVARLSA